MQSCCCVDCPFLYSGTVITRDKELYSLYHLGLITKCSSIEEKELQTNCKLLCKNDGVGVHGINIIDINKELKNLAETSP